MVTRRQHRHLRRAGLGLLAAAVLATLPGCGSQAPDTAAAPTVPTAPAVSLPVAAEAAAPATATATASASASASTSASASAEVGASAAAGAQGTRPAAPAPGATVQSLPTGSLRVAGAAQVTAEISGLATPAKLTAGGPAVEFTATLRNTGSTDYPSVAPLLRFDQYDGGAAPLGSVPGTLERFDQADGTWRPAPLPQAAGMDYLLAADGPVALPKGAEVSVRYRIALAPGLRPGSTALHLLAVSLPDHLQAGDSRLPVSIG
ncbi:hypothetical protein [Kitasatospora cineracea]|uniref:DUF11 domain-containing protein n=1 Tax=Kitasatospora cineracea TaxID=88074 RepID=A0A8G1XFB4_9ACTN|nr:hypothetical protein [Kitasatospora cineracea]ROR43642.1 hypothetical protein EDD39_1808 [Kitasatospora cineracea]